MDVFSLPHAFDWLAPTLVLGQFDLADYGVIGVIVCAVCMLCTVLVMEPATELLRAPKSFFGFKETSSPAELGFYPSAQQNSLALEIAGLTVWDWNINTGQITTRQFPTTLQQWLDQIHPDDFPFVRESLKTHLLGKSARFRTTYRWVQPGQPTRWIETRGRIYEYCERGTPNRMLGTHEDLGGCSEITSTSLASPDLAQRA